MVNSNERLAQLKQVHASAVMVGWDFSRLDGRLESDTEPWDFEADCAAAMRSACTIIDLGTGGGERLSALLASATLAEGAVVAATEGWEPNVDLARANLGPLGVEVHRYDAETGDRLGFEDRSADLIMSRHEAYDPDELARVLAPGGRFLTQQVDGFDARQIHEWFGADYLHTDVVADRAAADLEKTGFEIDLVEEWSGLMRFADVDALVTYIGFVPWDAPGFTVEAHAEKLLQLDEHGVLEVEMKRFRLHATKR